MTRYAMAIDKTRCVACGNCCMACKVHNNLPEGVLWNKPFAVGGEENFTPGGTYPDALTMDFYTKACQHCANPVCVAICPTGASYVKEDTNIVLINYDECIGCQSCIQACPYDVRVYMETAPSYTLDFAVGDADAPVHQGNIVEKCTFCSNRLERGERPACADVCRLGARWFGDVDDPDSDISKVLAERKHETLLPEQGTDPSVYFLI